ncbi:MAG: CRISPR-associated helicase Cas3' [Dehalococcoidia bacterium]|nr:CRISPR-associated helicase Cas3' [Dehalococcoidia bacterium]
MGARGGTKGMECWGKRSPDGSWHPLVDHCVDVAFAFRSLLELPRLARSLAELDPAQRERLAVLAFLHDFGKANRGFQAKAIPGARDTCGHVMEAVAFLREDCCRALWPEAWRELVGAIAGWFRDGEQALAMLLASLSHHGRPVSWSDYDASGIGHSAHRYWRKAGDCNPIASVAALADAAFRVFPSAFATGVPPIDAAPALQQRFAGLVMLADWIASDTRFFPYRKSGEEDRPALAREAARWALRAIGLASPDERSPRDFEEALGFAPSPVQAALLGKLPVDDSTRLLLLEAETGSGKTEAALAWFLRLYAAKEVDGLYFALPTRVAARELYGRVRRAIERAFPEEGARPRPVLLAVPGYARADGIPAGEVLANPHDHLWPDREEDRWRERLWSAEHPKRFLAAPVAVGTVDQAVLSALAVRHGLLRSVCLDRSLLVVDEVHASDPYLRELVRGLLCGHLGRGGWALLLSATLGESAAASLFGRDLLPLEEAMRRPYPLLSARDRGWSHPSTRQRRLRLEPRASLEDQRALLEPVRSALRDGARVLVVCNTVRRAIALFREVEKFLGEKEPGLLDAVFAVDGQRCPHHGRFAPEDRELLDEALSHTLGKGSASRPCLVIGTQTLEQSLDLDADLLLTDLAPIDVLLQRLGRLHRHDGRDRPHAFAEPRALVFVPEKPLEQYLDERGCLRGPAGLGAVYRDGRVLALTWELLRERGEVTLPDQARELIELATHPERLFRLGESWRRHGDELEGKVCAEVRQALRSLVDDRPFGELHYPDRGESVLTRLGLPTMELPLATPVRSPFGRELRSLPMPAHWLAGDDLRRITDVPVPVESDGRVLRFSVNGRRFRYSRLGLERDDPEDDDADDA